MPLTAGNRRRVVTVEQHDGTIDGGQPTYDTDDDWDTVSSMSSLPCEYRDVSGGERVRGLQMEATTTGLVTVLSTARTRAIKPRMRLVLGSRKLNVISVVDREGRRRELFIQVREQGDS